MEFFATGAFQQLYSELDEQAMLGADCFDQELFQQQQQQQQQPQLDYCYADVNFGNGYEPGGMDYYGIITLDSNNNNNNNSNICCSNSNSSEDQELLFDFGDAEPHELASFAIGSTSTPPELSDWEQRLLDHFVEIPELIDILPERTPLCTDMCDDFLQESNNNLRLAAPSSPAAATTTTAAATPLQLSHNAAGEKGYLCTFGSCEKLYAKPAHLKAHLRRHLGEKPYACNWPDCSWRFSRSDELARHRRSHSGVKPYKCDYCAKCFARSDHLTKHRKVHERRLLAATRSGKLLPNGPLPQSVYAVRPGRKRKNQL
ncbi:Krueppel-like factor 9 [Drosophila hydei]|uniref:Krueppel-like factor 9 n=1 Tax=Drosophila hydei TaxID=7224 RepID=A0A6J1M5P2_DROHY|nr:Krueppel-like factor 9 [Drosophila hydei]